MGKSLLSPIERTWKWESWGEGEQSLRTDVTHLEGSESIPLFEAGTSPDRLDLSSSCKESAHSTHAPFVSNMIFGEELAPINLVTVDRTKDKAISTKEKNRKDRAIKRKKRSGSLEMFLFEFRMVFVDHVLSVLSNNIFLVHVDDFQNVPRGSNRIVGFLAKARMQSIELFKAWW
ncbi:hypothetical protein V6N13_061968 [Hibiscus sabdariffa]